MRTADGDEAICLLTSIFLFGNKIEETYSLFLVPKE